MAIADYDPDVHHVGLGVDSSNLKGLITVGPHSKQLASPIFEKPSNVGTDDLIGSRSYSVWTQNDFTGGEFQEDWADPAMFSECVMMLPNPLGKSVKTCRPMVAGKLGNAVENATPVNFEIVDSALFVIFNNDTPRGRVYRFPLNDLESSPAAESVSTSFLPSGKIITAAAWNQSSEYVWIGSNEPKVHTYQWDNTKASGSRLVHKQNLGSPTLDADPIKRISGIHLFGKLRFISTRHGDGVYDDNRLWLYVSGTGNNAKWSKVGILPGDYVCSTTYNNAVYFLTRTGDSRTQLSMSQGDEVFPVLDFPYAFRGMAMCEYAGRLYIAGTGFDSGGAASYGELYEVTGTSLRLVRTWAGNVSLPTPDDTEDDNSGHQYVTDAGYGPINFPGQIQYPVGPIVGPVQRSSGGGEGEVRVPNNPPLHGGPVIAPGVSKHPVKRKMVMSHMKALVVNEGQLWMPDSSWTGLEAYDATTDGFFGGPRLRTGNDPDIEFTNLVAAGGRVIAWGVSADRSKQGLYVTELAEDSDIYYPYITTSDFAPEPSRDKLWNRFTALTRGDGAPYLDYSYDGGRYWFPLDADSSESIGLRVQTSWSLRTVPASRQLRLRIRFAMPGTANETAAELIATSLSFIVKGEDKKRFTFTVNAAVGVGDLGNDLFEQRPADVIGHLWAMKDIDTPIVYKDVDGVNYNVIVADLSTNRPAIDEDGEAYLPITLIEV